VEEEERDYMIFLKSSQVQMLMKNLYTKTEGLKIFLINSYAYLSVDSCLVKREKKIGNTFWI